MSLGMNFSRRPPRLKNAPYSAPRSFFVTFCAFDRQRAFAEANAARIACEAIIEYRRRELYYLYAYCVMPDHIHLVIKLTAGAGHLSQIIGNLKRIIRHRCAVSGCSFRWQPGYFDRIVREHERSDEFIRYVLLNPVRAGLVTGESRYSFCGRYDLNF
jgi:putative transposase